MKEGVRCIISSIDMSMLETVVVGNFIYTQTCIKNIVHYAFNTCILGIYEINRESRVIYEINPNYYYVTCHYLSMWILLVELDNWR